MDLLKSLFSSKKFIAMLSGLIVVGVLKVFKVNVDPATVAEIVGLIGAYILGQGVADNGKGAAQVAAVADVNASAPAATTPAEKIDAIKSV